ncbi:sulfur carrier protein ThiS adenylyltransferase ThiF [Deferribacter autotrophicus]|uniref:Sulfur carrier protein ThiS adenylyltransferase ThiF n=1 Tax=Deferribacter autotrophicus TaxID=500465 RepID=A0A5A8F8S2_9BACT|nr:sulfur carrier protein ThiS adenylyltransferase ThiF [Deferribacter autotrophicus]KAA0258932.1 sulfur carrier protein ThiS adenylyltransferase ThiF [Deferribacter autotrophicus]
MMTIFVNEKPTKVVENTTLFQLRDKIKPDADIVILNGHIMNKDVPLNNNDNVVLIKRGEIPSFDELEALMIARHTPGVHKKLKKGRVAIAGLGGLGSNIATSLARMGVGFLRLIDFDVVEPSNLNRQYYFIDQIGKKKTDALLETLKRINPYITYDPVDCFVDENNIKELFHDVDVIIEAFDKAETKALLIKKCMQLFPDKLIIGASGVAGIYDTSLLKIERLGKNVYVVGDFVNEAKPGEGLMATRVAVAANMQANLAVRYLVNDKNLV